MKHIAAIFLFTILCSLPLCRAREISLQGYSPALMSRISDTDRMLTSLFRLKRFRSDAIALEISGKYIPKPLLEIANGKMRLALPLDKPVFDDGKNFQALLSALFLSAGTRTLFSGAEEALPRWLCAGIANKLSANSSTERYLHGLHHLPAVSALYSSGRFPDLFRLPELSAELPPELREWYGEFARVLLETADDQKLLREYASTLFKTQKYSKQSQDLLEKLSGPLTAKDQEGRLKALEKILWNTYKPEPASRKLEQLPRMLKWQLPVLDEEGVPTEKMQACSLLELPTLLERRPDAAEQRKKAALRVSSFSTGCTYREADLFSRFAILVYNTPRNAEERQAQLQKAFDRLQMLLHSREQIEKFLAETEQKHCSAAQLLKHQLAVQNIRDSASAEQKKFLLEIEKTYSD